MASSDRPLVVAMTEWRSMGELGTIGAIRFVLFVSRFGGRAVARAMLYVVVLYYVLFSARVRRVSRDYLRRQGLPPRLRTVFRHVLSFAHCALDRVYFLSGEMRHFEIERSGHRLLSELVDSGRGGILVGGHLGSFEAMRGGADGEDLEIHVVGNFQHTEKLNRVLDSVGTNRGPRLIDAGRGDVSAALRINEVVKSGGVVAMLADRAHDGSTVPAQFLGGEVELPIGPWVLAAVAKCPVMLTFGLYTPPNRYNLYCELFAERIELPRDKRSEALQSVVQRYARRLEHYARLAPLNWFNFYDYWSKEGRTPSAPRAAP